MAQYELVGGSQDGQHVELDGPQRVGSTLLIAAGGQKSQEIYALCSDRKFHFLAYATPKISPADEPS